MTGSRGLHCDHSLFSRAEAVPKFQNFEAHTGFGRYQECVHSGWALVATSTLLADHIGTSYEFPDLSDRSADAKLRLLVESIWRGNGVVHVTPSADASGRLRVTNHEFHLRDAILPISRGMVAEKELKQVLRDPSDAPMCSEECGQCTYCQMGLLVACQSRAPLNCLSSVAIRILADEAHPDWVKMEFLVSPRFRLMECNYRVFNSWAYAAFGLFRNAQRSNFSSATALRSMWTTTVDKSLKGYVDRVTELGWLATVTERLQERGIVRTPYAHQVASVLVMLDMEGRLDTVFPSAPAYGRAGLKGFLQSSFVDIGTTGVVICALTGNILTRATADRVVAANAGGLLALPPGIGKTFTCVALAALTWTPGTYAAVISCPQHLALQWEDEIQRALPTAHVVRARHISDGDVRTRVATEPSLVTGCADRAGALDVPTFVITTSDAGREAWPAQRYIIDEAHDKSPRVDYASPHPVVWAVSASPFFAQTQRHDTLHEILQRIPRCFGVPVVHPQILSMLRKQCGKIFEELTINLHELEGMLPSVFKYHHHINFDNNQVIWPFDEALASGANESVLRRMRAAIELAEARGLALRADELLDFAARQPLRDRRITFPEWESVPDTGPHDHAPFDTGDCAVCISALTEEVATLLPCGHIFHYTCLRGWYTASDGRDRCPVCRSRYACTELRRYNAALEYSGEPGAPRVPAGRDRPSVWTFDEVHHRTITIIEDHMRKSEGKIVVFASQQSATRLSSVLSHQGIDHVNCIDAIGSERRALAIVEFIERSAPVMVIDPRSETGLNLTVANCIISYAAHAGSAEQMIGRARRLGQRFPVHFHQLRVDV